MEPVSFLTCHGKYICAEDGGGAEGQMVGRRPAGLGVANRDAANAWEGFSVARLGATSYALVSSGGRVGCAEDYGARGLFVFNRDQARGWETLRLVRIGDTAVAFNLEGTDLYLSAEPDGTLIVKRPGTPDGAPAAHEIFTPSSMAWITGAGGGGGGVVIPPITGRIVRPIVGYVRTQGKRWADDSGLRSMRICSWFPALKCYQDERDASLRQLDEIAKLWQGVRIFWHVWTQRWGNPGYSVDPRSPGFDERFTSFLRECSARDLRVSLSCGDMQDLCPDGNEDAWHEHMAHLAASVDQHTVSWWGIWNEGWQNSARGTDAAYAARLSHRIQSVFPWGAHALTDTNEEPGNLDAWNRHPSNNVMIHGLREWPDCVRRPFNTRFEGHGWLVNHDEPNGDGPDVFVGESDPRKLWAMYTMHVMVGFMTTFFGGHALKSWTPTAGLDQDWGFTQLPRVWQEMNLPEDIQTWTPVPGHHGSAPIYPERFENQGAGPHRCDGVNNGVRALCMPYAGRGQWLLRSRWDATMRVWTEEGVIDERRVSAGERVVTTDASERALVIELVR